MDGGKLWIILFSVAMMVIEAENVCRVHSHKS